VPLLDSHLDGGSIPQTELLHIRSFPLPHQDKTKEWKGSSPEYSRFENFAQRQTGKGGPGGRNFEWMGRAQSSLSKLLLSRKNLEGALRDLFRQGRRP